MVFFGIIILSIVLLTQAGSLLGEALLLSLERLVQMCEPLQEGITFQKAVAICVLPDT